MLDPSLKNEEHMATARKKQEFKDMMLRLDETGAYKALFSNLWYSTLPCFDDKGITAEKDGERSILKYCEWKGKPMSCSAIFTTFPTDRGMCCSFNMKAAEDVFKGNNYPQLVKKLQSYDKSHSFIDSELPKKYTLDKETTSLPGRTKGLTLILDSHKDLLAAGSVDSDYYGFMGFIGTNTSFPILNLYS